MLRVRASSLAVAVAALLASCARSSSAPARSGPSGPSASGPQQTGVVGTFTGTYDPSSGKLSIEVRAPAASAPDALVVAVPYPDGHPGTGPVNSFEIVTDPSFLPTPVANGCGVGVNSFEGDITIRSFFRNQSLRNVYAEITALSPSGHGVCNPDPVSGTLTPLDPASVWAYGDLDPDGTASVAVTKRWKFRFQNNQEFSFTGRVWATLAAPVPRSGDPEFNWYATSLVDPPRTFKPVATTVSHIVWNGTGWTDAVGGAIFVKQGTGGGSVDTGLSDTVQPYATFSSGEYWTFDPAGAATPSYWDLSGNFTVCAKVKPGVLPPFPHPPDHIKTFFAKGNPTIPFGHLGWALMEMNAEYCFHYGTPTSNTDGTELMAAHGPPLDPETFTYDYICGGRAGTALWIGIGGVEEVVSGTSEGGSFAGMNLPLAIGAFANGDPATAAGDAGVYEIIIDSRPPLPGTMAEIVGLAEGRLLRGVVGGVATLDAVNATSMAILDVSPDVAVSTPVAGADGKGYVLPSYATVPLVTDGSGLLPAGTTVIYTHPLFEDTRTTGFCAGAELVATGAWASVGGGIFGMQSGDIRIGLFPGDPGAVAWSDPNNVVLKGLPGGWLDRTAHVFQVCVDPASGSPVSLYADAALLGIGSGNLPNLSDRNQNVAFGSVYPGQFSPFPSPALSGARIRRVFICPDPNPAHCQ